MTRGPRVCPFSSLRSRRLAACLSRRLWTKTSSTTPSWSTARQSQCFLPPIIRHTSSRCHLSPVPGSRRRIWLAKACPNLRAHWRTVSEELFHLDQVAIAQNGLERRDPGVGAQHEQAVIARLLGNLADLDREGLLRGRAQVAAVGGVADQRLVAPLELLIERRNDRGAVGGVLLRLSFVPADDIAPALDLDLFDEELGLRAPGPRDAQGREGPVIGEHHGAHPAVRALARAQHVFEAALLERGDGR